VVHVVVRWLVATLLPACLSLPARPPDTTSDGPGKVDAGQLPDLFGSDTRYSVSTELTAGTTFAASFIPAQGGVVKSIVVYVTAHAANTRVVAGLYDDDGGGGIGVPGTEQEQGEITISTTPGWYPIVIGHPTSVAGGNIYWLAVMCPATACGTLDIQLMSAAAPGTCMESSDPNCIASTVSTGIDLPVAWTSATRYAPNAFSIYASEQ
jgi:hypothetical protein